MLVHTVYLYEKRCFTFLRALQMYEIETCWNEMCLQAIFMAKYVLFVRVHSVVG